MLSELSSDQFFMHPSQSFAALILSSSQVLPLSTGGSLVTFKTSSREMTLTSESICLHIITRGKETRVSNTRHIPLVNLGYTFRATEGPRRLPSSILDPNRRGASVCKAHTSSEGGGGHYSARSAPPHTKGPVAVPARARSCSEPSVQCCLVYCTCKHCGST